MEKKTTFLIVLILLLTSIPVFPGVATTHQKDMIQNSESSKTNHKLFHRKYLHMKFWISDRYGDYVSYDDVSSILSGDDPALSYFGLNDYFSQNYRWADGDPRDKLNGDITVAVLDDGLSCKDWVDLKNTLDLNIVAYVTGKTENSTPSPPMVFYSVEDLNISGMEDIFARHSVATLSALATVARGLNVLFIDLAFDDAPLGLGFVEAMQFLVDNGELWGVDIVLTMMGIPTNDEDVPTLESLSSILYSRNYFMVCGSGNEGTQYNYYDGHDGGPPGYYFYPQESPYWFTISSIDFDDIGCIFDHDRYSVKDHWSGSAVASHLRASWGATSYSANSVDWSMPGNQVPVFSDVDGDRYGDNSRKWMYDYGTSFSAPYFAGVVTILIDGYMDGYLAFGKTAPRLSIDRIKDLLWDVSSLTTFNYKLGYGFVNAHDAYSIAYQTGYLEAKPPGGGGGGPGPHPY